MLPVSQKTTLCAAYPAPFFPAGSGLESCHAPLAPRMTHGQQHGLLSVAHHVAHDVARDVAQTSAPGCSFWAAGARPVRIPARAAALLLRKAATGLPALGLKPASLLRTAPASLPVPRSHRAPAGQGQKQHQRGGRRRKLACERSAKPFPKTPARAPAPDWRPIRSGSLAHDQGRQSVALRAQEAPHRSRLGTLPPLSLVGTRDCFRRDRLSQRWGASFPLLRLGASHHGSPAPGGLRKPSLFRAKLFALAPSLGRLRTRLRWRTRKRACHARSAWGCGRSPYQKPNLDQTRSSRGWSWFKRLRSTIKARPMQFKARPNA
jgi:hypothetical protein